MRDTSVTAAVKTYKRMSKNKTYENKSDLTNQTKTYEAAKSWRIVGVLSDKRRENNLYFTGFCGWVYTW